MRNSLVLLLLLTSCSHVPTTQQEKIYYQDHFWVGCVNAWTHLKKDRGYEIDGKTIREASEWCKQQYEKVKDL